MWIIIIKALQFTLKNDKIKKSKPRLMYDNFNRFRADSAQYYIINDKVFNGIAVFTISQSAIKYSLSLHYTILFWVFFKN